MAIQAALIALCLSNACVRRDARNSDCRRPGESRANALRAGESGYAEHLGADAEFAEELAIRYMDVHHGPALGEVCLAAGG